MTATVRARTTTLTTSAISSRKRTSHTAKATKANPKPALTTTPKPPSNPISTNQSQSQSQSIDPALLPTLRRLTTHPSLTPHQRKVYRTLLSIPRGRWTTYATLASHLSSSPRAIGNAMRTNPFAPDVPCHRVLASDRTVGGYKGKWGSGGDYATEKVGLLRGEGVVFDGKGRVVGECFGEFWEVVGEGGEGGGG
ncbi:hypothetical protein PAAG_03339 [Paracoccidioides lutzii Pb01]|uniref:Methylated-DNA--protein-cysteine methyltransferase n=1 Tax=Paracoccidioides lutzii (strain ATCC MYA-826 / Pb01) TaxID=502779 RepID=C1GWW5_PARBA|nr:hypothetical protein PAAG_03339 [Paracoccidioides lutzii Pb01]EEH41053.1 hypothetical protein PAAG_03339 [Paracoccidioides lutzii Pb01]